MRYQDQGSSLVRVYLEKKLSDLVPGASVEVAGGFVGEQHLGVRRERPRDCDTLLFAAGKLVRVVIDPGLQADLGQYRLRAGAWLPCPCQLERQHYILKRGQAVE